MADTLTMYSTTWCGHCRRLQRQLDAAGISYRIVDVDQQPHHGDRIAAHTGGFRTVPTLEVDGRLLVNPSLEQVEAALAG